MDFWILLGAVGSFASVIGLLLPLQTKHQRLMHVAYSCALALISAVAVWYWGQAYRVKSVERQATALVAGFSSDYTAEGFILATLAFLEKNRDLYPDAYSRAHNMCLNEACIKNRSEVTNLSFAFKGLITGIGALERGD
nr:hypothetical protein [uncultured Roseateles sp.]